MGIGPSERVAITGPSGSGKTSAVVTNSPCPP